MSHYAPMTSDLVDLCAEPISFRLGAPFLPFQQLLGCLPASSAGFLPASYRELMVSTASPLRAFYPEVASIKVDMNGKVNTQLASWRCAIIVQHLLYPHAAQPVGGRNSDSFHSGA